MENINDLIRECIYSTPLVLLSIIESDESLIDEIDEYLPYSTGFEIECNKSEDFNIEHFKAIPNILDVSIDSWEQRFRIPAGINGLICLYNISYQLKYNSTLNESSGVHYHVDMTDCFSQITETFRRRNCEWILDELDEWDYRGEYNLRNCNYGWVKYNPLQTLEIRIGEMTFDYEILVKRIIHCNSIVRRLKKQLNVPKPKIEGKIITTSELLLFNEKLKYTNTEESKKLFELLSSLEEEKEEKEKIKKSKGTIEKIVKSRIVKL